MSKKKSHLLVVAHPDDETIFFGGLLASPPKKNWCVVCVTDGNADGQGALRKLQFQDALEQLGVKEHVFLDHRDCYESRLDTVKLISQLKELGSFETIFTHGPLGEYGHPHHQDVCFAVHEAFKNHKKVFSVAQNVYPELTVKLTAKQFETKTKILSKTYFSETERFIFFVPATSGESFVRLSLGEVHALYRFWTENKMPSKRDLKHYQWILPYLPTARSQLAKRPF